MSAAPDPPHPPADELDPDVRRFVRASGAAWAAHPDLGTVSPAEARRIAEAVRAPWVRGGPRMAARREHRVDTPGGAVRLRCYHPVATDRPQPALIALHGGGWTLFSLDSYDRVMRELAARAGIVVVGVDYALAPEAKYPVALDQVRAVVRHLAAEGAALGVDPRRLALGGDSAGANLALAAALALRDAGRGEILRALTLHYGVFARRSSPEAERRFGGPGHMLTSAEMEGFWGNYLRSESDADDPLVCPLRADLRGLPPTLLVVPECDLLAEQSLRLGELLRGAGVPARLEVYRGACHSFLEAVSISALASRALDDVSGWLAERLG